MYQIDIHFLQSFFIGFGQKAEYDIEQGNHVFKQIASWTDSDN